VAVGDRIAQLLVLKTAEIEDVVEKRKLSNSARADGGFGSTGVATTHRKHDGESTMEESDTETTEESNTETTEESNTETTEESDTETTTASQTSMDETTTDADYEPSSDEDM